MIFYEGFKQQNFVWMFFMRVSFLEIWQDKLDTEHISLTYFLTVRM
jgi:hypothetical protein